VRELKTGISSQTECEGGKKQRKRGKLGVCIKTRERLRREEKTKLGEG